MVLESLQTDKINIKSLILEEPTRSDALFSPEKDLKQVWPNIVNNLEMKKESSLWPTILEQTAVISLIDPEKALELNINSEDLTNMTKNLRGYEILDNHFASDSMYLKMISPQMASQIEDNPKVKMKMEILKESRLETDNKLRDHTYAYTGDLERLHSIFVQAANVKVAFPELEDLNFLPQFIEKEAEFAKQQMEDLKRFVQLENLLTSLVALKILFPEQFSKMDLLNDQNWQQMEGWLKGLRDAGQTSPFHLDLFLSVAFHMKILAAKEIKISKERGLELIMSQKQDQFKQPKLSLPEVRKF